MDWQDSCSTLCNECNVMLKNAIYIKVDIDINNDVLKTEIHYIFLEKF